MFAATPQDTRRVVEFGRPDAMNPEERWTANLLTQFLAYGVGAPSLVATAFVGAVSVWYAWINSTDLQTFFAYAIGLLAIAALSSGLPIAWAATRGNDTVVARASLGLWTACVLMNVVTMLHFARHVPAAPVASAVQAAAPSRPQPAVRAPNLREDAIERLDDKISELWYLVTDYDQELATAKAAKRERLLSAEDRRRYALAKTQLEQLEIRRYGAPVVLKDAEPDGPGRLEFQGYGAPEPAPASVASIPAPAPESPGLDMAVIALIMIAVSAVGLLISAGSLAAVMLAKVRERRAQPVEDLVPEAMPAPGPRIHSGESLDGFNLWIGKCLSPSRNGEVRPAQAFAHYEAFCAANNVRARLGQSNFYTRFSQHLGAVYGIASAHSNGPVYRGVALFDDAEMGALNGHDGALNGHAGALNGYAR
jgi:hypothetical protein